LDINSARPVGQGIVGRFLAGVVVTLEFSYSPGATPVDPDEAAGLLPKHITIQAELNAWEEANIVTAENWAFRKRKRELLEESLCESCIARCLTRLGAGRAPSAPATRTPV
jgi:hypothetical protein